MLPRLMAEESVRTANRVAVGSGTLAADDRKELVTSWQRQMGHTPKAKPADPRTLAGIGVGVRRGPVRKDPRGH